MATKKKEETQGPVRIALAHTTDRQEEVDQAVQSRVRVRFPSSYQFNLEGMGAYVVPVGSAIEVPKEVAEALAQQQLPEGVEWAANTDQLPLLLPNTIVTPPAQVTEANRYTE
jgi:hypothetical protein